MHIRGLFIIIAVIILAITGYLLLQGSQRELPTPSSQVPLPEPTPTPKKDSEESTMDEEAGEIREIVVEGDEFSFSPASITVAEGEKVRLTFNNIGKTPHNFIVDELGISTETIQGGSSDTIEFTAVKSGTFSFYCSVGNHRSLGMEGKLEVN